MNCSYWQWIILVTIATGAVMAFAISKIYDSPMYESTSELYVHKAHPLTSLADIQTGTSTTNDYIVVADTSGAGSGRNPI